MLEEEKRVTLEEEREGRARLRKGGARKENRERQIIFVYFLI